MARVLLVYKNFGAFQGVSHIGLGVSAANTAKALNDVGIETNVLPIKDQFDLRKQLNLSKSAGEDPYTHVVVSAPWISTAAYSQLCAMFPQTHFAVNCHSNVGFLQADARGIELLREGLQLERGTWNFHVSANSRRLQEFIVNAYDDPCAYLPNIYFMPNSPVIPHHPGWNETGGTLRIGVFGATRTLKNMLSAIGAAIVVSRDLRAETEIWINTGRVDSPEVARILQAAKALVKGVPLVTLKEAPWAAWPDFRKLVGSMHLLLQPSYTESFNMVTADGASQAIPSVVSDAIQWAPREWQADVDDVESIARTATSLIFDTRAGSKGYMALRAHNADAVRAWRTYLGA